MQRLVGAILLLVLVVSGTLGFAAQVPPLTGVFNDPASVVSPAKRDEIIAFLREQETKTSNQIAVLVVRNQNVEDLEEFSNRAFNTWKLGQAGKDNGVLLVVAVQDGKDGKIAEGKARIEVGRGLEGALPDILSRRIIEEKAVPNFKVRKFGSGILETVMAIDKAVHNEYKPDPRPAQQATTTDPFVVVVVVVGFLVVMGLLFLFLSAGQPAPVPARTRNRPESGNGSERYRPPVSRRGTRRKMADDDFDLPSSQRGNTPIFSPPSDSGGGRKAAADDSPSLTDIFKGGGGESAGGGATVSFSVGGDDDGD